RDITDRLNLFTHDNTQLEVKRIALTMKQIQLLKPPPNPAKIEDSRCTSYIEDYGSKSWELDALNPEYITDLIEKHVNQYINQELWDEVNVRKNIEIIRKIISKGGD
ncbi:hypothetical protein LCGC14_2732270, partial [marine sediment metagenome]